MCKTCGKKKCCCNTTVVSRKGLVGPRGPRGLQGPPGPPGEPGELPYSGEFVVSESASFGTLYGPIGLAPTGTNFSNLENNFFQATQRACALHIDAGVQCAHNHTVTFYFKKNGIQVGPSRTVDMPHNGHINFHTNLILFQTGDTLTFYIESSRDDSQLVGGVIHLVRQIPL